MPVLDLVFLLKKTYEANFGLISTSRTIYQSIIMGASSVHFLVDMYRLVFEDIYLTVSTLLLYKHFVNVTINSCHNMFLIEIQ